MINVIAKIEIEDISNSNRLTGSFFSRRMGWIGGTPVKNYHSKEFIIDINLDSLILEDRTGQDICVQIQSIPNITPEIQRLYDLSLKYRSWYFYSHPSGCPVVITSIKSL